MDYWREVYEHWRTAEAVADDPDDVESVTMKRMFPLSFYSTIPIAITGLRGTGKTVLYDALLGRVGVDYKPRGRSDDVEPHMSVIKPSKGPKRRVNARVIPGDESSKRTEGFQRDFGDNGRHPVGIIHVVCSGYNRIWKSPQRQAIKEDLAAAGKPVDLAGIRDNNTSLAPERTWHPHRGIWKAQYGSSRPQSGTTISGLSHETRAPPTATSPNTCGWPVLIRRPSEPTGSLALSYSCSPT